MTISTEQIKELRDRTGISMMSCKKALEEANGDIEKAILRLRKEGAKVADKKSERALKAGIVASYVHATKKVGVLLEARSETDFVAKNEGFQEMAYNIAMHIAGMNPKFINESEIGEAEKAEILKICEEQVKDLDKPEEIKKKIVEGRVNDYIKERTLMFQPYIKNPDLTIADYVKDSIQKFGENIEISRFVRYSV
jgi:elongation factor Ts